MSATILLVEDNPHIMEINYEALIMEDYKVLRAQDGRACMEMLKRNEVDLIVLDIMLPDADGLELCGRIKAEYGIPILFLSALGENEQIIQGLRAGGDDYLAKPYDIGVLLARIEARLRTVPRVNRYGKNAGLRMDTSSLTAWYGQRDLLLNRKEFLLLNALLRNPGQRIGKEELYRTVWGVNADGDFRALHTAVSRLNKKLKDAGTGQQAVWRGGDGYALEEM